jgi:hypothetical protein
MDDIQFVPARVWLKAAEEVQTPRWSWLQTVLRTHDLEFTFRELAVWCHCSGITSLASLLQRRDELKHQLFWRTALLERTQERLLRALDQASDDAAARERALRAPPPAPAPPTASSSEVVARRLTVASLAASYTPEAEPPPMDEASCSRADWRESTAAEPSMSMSNNKRVAGLRGLQRGMSELSSLSVTEEQSTWLANQEASASALDWEEDSNPVRTMHDQRSRPAIALAGSSSSDELREESALSAESSIGARVASSSITHSSAGVSSHPRPPSLVPSSPGRSTFRVVDTVDTTGDGLLDSVVLDVQETADADTLGRALSHRRVAKMEFRAAPAERVASRRGSQLEQNAWRRGKMAKGDVAIDISGNGSADAVVFDTVGDGQIDTLVPMISNVRL